MVSKCKMIKRLVKLNKKNALTEICNKQNKKMIFKNKIQQWYSKDRKIK